MLSWISYKVQLDPYNYHNKWVKKVLVFGAYLLTLAQFLIIVALCTFVVKLVWSI